ncbi:hypothetical protein [Bacillus sp. REN16]|nr:hypothetical protein [Bacillus sp. REN16]MCC3359152.1 hypothetical protein [Bacillus sp. REN16]
MNKKRIETIENNIIAAAIGFMIAYVIGSFIFPYDLGSGAFWQLFE